MCCIIHPCSFACIEHFMFYYTATERQALKDNGCVCDATESTNATAPEASTAIQGRSTAETSAS